jgi:hypothetical protein
MRQRRRQFRIVPDAPPSPALDVPAWQRRPVGILVVRIVDSLRPEEIFGPTQIAQEVNRLYGSKLSTLVDGRAASVTLRRLAATGRLHVIRAVLEDTACEGRVSWTCTDEALRSAEAFSRGKSRGLDMM